MGSGTAKHLIRGESDYCHSLFQSFLERLEFEGD